MNLSADTGLNVTVLTDGNFDLKLWQLLLTLLLVVAQGVFLFFDGRKQGVRYYWFWALWGLTTCPVPFLLYMVLVRGKRKSIRAQSSPQSLIRK